MPNIIVLVLNKKQNTLKFTYSINFVPKYAKILTFI